MPLEILAPLAAVTDLPSHPMLSRPFTSKSLTELIGQGRSLMQKENAALWRAKPLLTKLVGDNTWAPCGLMLAADDRDVLLFTDSTSFFNRPAAVAPTVNGARTASKHASTKLAQRTTHLDGHEDEAATQLLGGAAQRKADKSGIDGPILPDGQDSKIGEGEAIGGSSAAETAERYSHINGNPGHDKEDGHRMPEGDSSREPNAADGEDVDMADGPGAAPSTREYRDLPRPTSPDPDPDSVDEHFIHPLFRLPEAAHPERDLSLPEQEAEEVRRLLLLYVQKQEEICRGTNRLYEGLLKADRFRRTVWQWAKAEAHCGPNRDMSDGEDWYDKEEWGLTEDLKKGEDEVEEDTTQTQKKTRNRK